MTVKSNNINRYYFWGEGQNYKNDLEIFFSDATVYVEQFYAKRDIDTIRLKIFKNFKTHEKQFLNFNHFNLMFNEIALNYKNKNFQHKHRNLIKNQVLLLSRSF